jgi:hypothetical protein
MQRSKDRHQVKPRSRQFGGESAKFGYGTPHPYETIVISPSFVRHPAARTLHLGFLHEDKIMLRKLVMTTLLAGSLATIGTAADAKGCIKGAIVGGVAGHYAHHHALAGAAAGCVAGHYIAKHNAQKKAAAQRQAQAAHR